MFARRGGLAFALGSGGFDERAVAFWDEGFDEVGAPVVLDLVDDGFFGDWEVFLGGFGGGCGGAGFLLVLSRLLGGRVCGGAGWWAVGWSVVVGRVVIIDLICLRMLRGCRFLIAIAVDWACLGAVGWDAVVRRFVIRV